MNGFAFGTRRFGNELQVFVARTSDADVRKRRW